MESSMLNATLLPIRIRHDAHLTDIIAGASLPLVVQTADAVPVTAFNSRLAPGASISDAVFCIV